MLADPSHHAGSSDGNDFIDGLAGYADVGYIDGFARANCGSDIKIDAGIEDHPDKMAAQEQDCHLDNDFIQAQQSHLV